MHGNVGEKWVQIKRLDLNGLVLSNVGKEFVIKDYYSVPHGYASIEYKGQLLFIQDKVFTEHFVTSDEYKKYRNLGDTILINANGNLGKYTIDGINGDGCYITLELKEV